MKKLQLKVRDLTNPTILTHHEIKNILGGQYAPPGDGGGIDGVYLTCCWGDPPQCADIREAVTCNSTPGGIVEYCKSYYPQTNMYFCMPKVVG